MGSQRLRNYREQDLQKACSESSRKEDQEAVARVVLSMLKGLRGDSVSG